MRRRKHIDVRNIFRFNPKVADEFGNTFYVFNGVLNFSWGTLKGKIINTEENIQKLLLEAGFANVPKLVSLTAFYLSFHSFKEPLKKTKNHGDDNVGEGKVNLCKIKISQPKKLSY